MSTLVHTPRIRCWCRIVTRAKGIRFCRDLSIRRPWGGQVRAVLADCDDRLVAAAQHDPEPVGFNMA